MSNKDFWTRHNIGMRFMILVFTLSFLGLVVASIFGVLITPEIFYTVSGITVFVYATIALGTDGIMQIAEIVSKHFKGK